MKLEIMWKVNNSVLVQPADFALIYLEKVAVV